MATLHHNPIWRDIYHVTDAASARYRIDLDGRTIFSGRAVRYPDDEYLRINVNKICRSYLETDIAPMLEGMPTQVTEYEHPMAAGLFKLYVDGTNTDDYRFYQDWSYTTDKTPGGVVSVSDPVNGRFVPGMLKLRTWRTPSRVYTECVSDDEPGLGYNTLVACKPYVLYYLNAYGGWDALVIEGRARRRDNYTTFKTDRSFDDTTLEYELNAYVNEVRTSWELTTGFLSDEEGDNVARNLAGSVKVYLQNTVEGWVRPVVITDTAVEWQSYQGNGKRMCQYRINVQESQSRLRK